MDSKQLKAGTQVLQQFYKSLSLVICAVHEGIFSPRIEELAQALHKAASEEFDHTRAPERYPLDNEEGEGGGNIIIDIPKPPDPNNNNVAESVVTVADLATVEPEVVETLRETSVKKLKERLSYYYTLEIDQLEELNSTLELFDQAEFDLTNQELEDHRINADIEPDDELYAETKLNHLQLLLDKFEAACCNLDPCTCVNDSQPTISLEQILEAAEAAISPEKTTETITMRNSDGSYTTFEVEKKRSRKDKLAPTISKEVEKIAPLIDENTSPLELEVVTECHNVEVRPPCPGDNYEWVEASPFSPAYWSKIDLVVKVEYIEPEIIKTTCPGIEGTSHRWEPEYGGKWIEIPQPKVIAPIINEVKPTPVKGKKILEMERNLKALSHTLIEKIDQAIVRLQKRINCSDYDHKPWKIAKDVYLELFRLGVVSPEGKAELESKIGTGREQRELIGLNHSAYYRGMFNSLKAIREYHKTLVAA